MQYLQAKIILLKEDMQSTSSGAGAPARVRYVFDVRKERTRSGSSARPRRTNTLKHLTKTVVEYDLTTVTGLTLLLTFSLQAPFEAFHDNGLKSDGIQSLPDILRCASKSLRPAADARPFTS